MTSGSRTSKILPNPEKKSQYPKILGYYLDDFKFELFLANLILIQDNRPTRNHQRLEKPNLNQISSRWKH